MPGQEKWVITEEVWWDKGENTKSLTPWEDVLVPGKLLGLSPQIGR